MVYKLRVPGLMPAPSQYRKSSDDVMIASAKKRADHQCSTYM